MPLAIPNTTVSSQSYTDPLTFAGNDVFGYGFFTVANQGCFVQLAAGRFGVSQEYPELFIPPGTYPIESGRRIPLGGIRFRAAGTATPAAQVFGALFYPGETTVQAGNPFSSTVSPSGGITPGQLTLTVQHNDVLVAAEPVLDIEDLATNSRLLWTVADDPANTRVKVTPQAPRFGVEHNGALVAAEQDVNLVDGGGLTWTVADVAASSRVDVTPAIAGLPNVLLRKTSSTDVNTTTTETDILGGGLTIPANALSTNKRLIIEVEGDFLNSGAAANAPRLVVRYGGAIGPPPTGTTLIDTGVGGATTITAAARVGWILRVVMMASATNVQYGSIDFELPGIAPGASVNAVFTTGLGLYNLMTANSFLLGKAKGVSNGTIGVDSTLSQLFTIGVINGAALATYSFRCNRGIAYVL